MKIVIVDDHLMFAQVLADICRQEAHTVLAIATSAEGGVEAVKIHAPELIVCDLVLPDVDGFGVILASRQLLPDIKVLVISSRMDANTAYRIDQHHCQGSVDKNSGFEEFRLALREVASGRCHFSRSHCALRKKLIDSPNSFPKVLSSWQQVVLMDVGSLKSDGEIARARGVTESAVAKLKQRASRRLGLKSVGGLVNCARKLGLFNYHP